MTDRQIAYSEIDITALLSEEKRFALGNYKVYRNDTIGRGGATAISVKYHQLSTPENLQ